MRAVPERAATASPVVLREVLRRASLPAPLRAAIERALAASPGGPVALDFLDAFGGAGAAVRASLAAPPPAVVTAPGESTSVTTHPTVSPADALFSQPHQARPAVVAAPGESTSVTTHPPASSGEASSSLVPATRSAPPPKLPLLDDPGTRPDPAAPLIADPDRVMSRVGLGGGSGAVHVAVLSKQGAPHTGEVVARTLAGLYGPFTAANPPQNRAAIIDALLWIAGFGIQYDGARAATPTPTTQPPNVTFSTRSGVCRDIHTAVAAVLASLGAARQGPGGWEPGWPSGRESEVQTIGFDNPAEYHAYLVYRDPASGRWNALEYQKHYAVQAENALDAFRSLPGFISGYTRYTLDGWDGRPFVAELGAVGAARSNAFMSADPGTGAPGELRVSGGRSDLAATGFLTRNLSLTGAIDPSALGNGLRGGLKLNVSHDWEDADTRGHLRFAGGVTADFFDASNHTGVRSAADRGRFQTYVLALKVDGRIEGKERALLGEHLKASWGVDLDGLGGVPLSRGGKLPGFVVPVGAITDYSRLNLGAEGGLGGHERLSDSLALDWAVRLRYQADLVQVGTELLTSGGTQAGQSLLRDPPTAEFALALTQTAGGVTTRIEAGGTQRLGAPYDAQTTPLELHHAVLTVDNGVVNFGLVARGETIDRKFIPVNGIGVALNVTPTKEVSVGVSAQSVFPGGDLKDVAPNVQVMGNLTLKL